MTTHGLRYIEEYSVWINLKQRCNNPNHPAYKNYGERGIKVSKEWENSFEIFYTDMGSRPSAIYTIERHENNEGYCKENCYWATRKEQNNNTRENHFIIINGIKKTISQWGEEYNIHPNIISNRINQGGWDEVTAVITPIIIPKHITYNGKTKSIEEWSKETGINRRLIRERIASGWFEEDAVSKPVVRNLPILLEYNGITKTLNEWAKEHGMHPETLKSRLKKMTIEEALNRPLKQGQRNDL